MANQIIWCDPSFAFPWWPMWWSGNDNAAVNCVHEHVRRPLLRCNCPGTNLGHRHGFALHDTSLKWVTHFQLVSKRASGCHPSLWPPARDGCILFECSIVYEYECSAKNETESNASEKAAREMKNDQVLVEMIACGCEWLQMKFKWAKNVREISLNLLTFGWFG